MRPEIEESVFRYAREHCPTGGFLRAVLSNDLFGAIRRADLGNQRDIVEICTFIYNKIPGNCWGSKKIYREWIEQGQKEV